MHILKRFLLCTTFIVGVSMVPAKKALANPTTVQTAMETEDQSTSTVAEVTTGAGFEVSNGTVTEVTTGAGCEITNGAVQENSNEIVQEVSNETEIEVLSEDINQVPKGTVIEPSEDSKKTANQTTKSTSKTSKSTSKTTKSTSKTSKSASKSTKSKDASSNKEVKLPKMYINVSDYRTQLLMKTAESAPKDKNYSGKSIKITGKNRELLEALVYGEAGGEGFIGQCLVAQAIRDTMLEEKETDVQKIIKQYKYAGKTNHGTSQEVKDAVKFIFDDGGYVVKHRIVFFYAPKLCKSRFHEKQKFIMEWNGHRFFDNSVWIQRDLKNSQKNSQNNK